VNKSSTQQERSKQEGTGTRSLSLHAEPTLLAVLQAAAAVPAAVARCCYKGRSCGAPNVTRNPSDVAVPGFIGRQMCDMLCDMLCDMMCDMLCDMMCDMMCSRGHRAGI
jgi:hypothetical protein